MFDVWLSRSLTLFHSVTLISLSPYVYTLFIIYLHTIYNIYLLIITNFSAHSWLWYLLLLLLLLVVVVVVVLLLPNTGHYTLILAHQYYIIYYIIWLLFLFWPQREVSKLFQYCEISGVASQGKYNANNSSKRMACLGVIRMIWKRTNLSCHVLYVTIIIILYFSGIFYFCTSTASTITYLSCGI